MNPILKAPNERLDYQEDWSAYLDTANAETISTSVWTIPTGLTQYGSATNDTTTATVWLSGGTHGEEYLIVNKITTNANRIAERSIKILCRNR